MPMTDFSSATWHSLRKWAEEQLRKARERNEAVDLSERDTAALRGEIRILKRFLDLPNEASRNPAMTPD